MNELLARVVYRRAKDSNAKRGRSYFLLAVDGGNLAAVERFVEVGASINMTDSDTSGLPPTAIGSCAHFGHVEIAEFLIDKGINVSAVDRWNNGALHSAVMGECPKEAMVTLLVEAGAGLKTPWCLNSPLHIAAERGNVRIVQRLLDLGADLNAAADGDGTTPLHRAALWGETENVKVLLEMGADASSVDRQGNTPLMLALPHLGNQATVHRILHLGTSMGIRPRETPAECVPSCQLEQSNHMTIEMLLAAGADIAKANSLGRSPVTWAVARTRGASFRPVMVTGLPD